PRPAAPDRRIGCSGRLAGHAGSSPSSRRGRLEGAHYLRLLAFALPRKPDWPRRGLALALHAIAAVIWVGGMFFAFPCLRPTLELLDPQLRARMWASALSRFFRWIWACVAVLLVTGIWMVFGHFHGLLRV